MYILAKSLAYHLQLKCMGGHFFLGHPYIDSTTVLSDIYIYIYTVRTRGKAIITMALWAIKNII